ncbi:MAG TPA: hypothetical protein VHZ24_22790 [Pirellulales bacterium]|jgi:hypothetical protein|nr:hypothetical protein [Pirellulales bacterium]
MLSVEQLADAIYEDLNAQIVRVSIEDNTYRVAFRCDDWQGAARQRQFTLSFQGVREATVTPSFFEVLLAETDHSLLWNHNDEHVSMFFSSKPNNPMEIVGRLYEAHTQLLNVWRPLSDYLHANTTSMQNGYGLLAKGPKKVIDEYARVVGSAMRYTIIRDYVPAGDYRVVLFDNSYIVYRGVSAAEQTGIV